MVNECYVLQYCAEELYAALCSYRVFPDDRFLVTTRRESDSIPRVEHGLSALNRCLQCSVLYSHSSCMNALVFVGP